MDSEEENSENPSQRGNSRVHSEGSFCTAVSSCALSDTELQYSKPSVAPHFGSELYSPEGKRDRINQLERKQSHDDSAPAGAPGAPGAPGADGTSGGPPPPPNTSSNRRLQQTQAQVEEVVDIMRVNVDKVLERDQKLSELDDRADALQAGASQFESCAAKLKNKYWWKNCKMMIMMGIIGVIVVGIIFLYFFY
ncbi:hypothetical protein fugu_010241 [Takifugu bimaculatus]|uniref:V-SNARE coiled-coil homology domain-containing protein n=1 Tax=Takifugu bimaculatus TaxID=433685 RepID=A0A4Z2CF72_9TELE|nr:hypothetical protein fugu_010241 [Takifugu bimaculatus]